MECWFVQQGGGTVPIPREFITPVETDNDALESVDAGSSRVCFSQFFGSIVDFPSNPPIGFKNWNLLPNCDSSDRYE